VLDHFVTNRAKWLGVGSDRLIDEHEVFEHKRLSEVLRCAWSHYVADEDV
jgi:hypothetical protein